MSVYTELIRVGVHEETAREIDAAIYKSQRVVTVEILDERLAQLETRLVRTTMTTMIALTGVYAVFVAAMGWVVR